MADETAIARRYARALMALGKEGDIADTLATDLEKFDVILGAGDGQLSRALNHPALLPSERRGVMEAMLEKVPVHTHVANTIRLMLDKGRASLLSDLVREFGKLADVEAGRVRAHVTTATKLSKPLAANVQKSLEASTGKTVLIDFSVDPDLIGGMVVKVGSIVYDASVRNRLDLLKQTLLTNSHIVPAEA